MKIVTGDREQPTAGTGLLKTPFSAANRRSLSLFGLAGGLLLIGLIAAGSGQPSTAADAKASNFSADTPHIEPKKEDKADEHAPGLSTPAPSPNDDTSSSSSQSTDLEVNGQSITVPENGEVHRVITENNSRTTVDVTTQSSDGSSSTDINVRSFSSSSSQ